VSGPIAADLLTRAGAPGNGFTFLMAGAATEAETRAAHELEQVGQIPEIQVWRKAYKGLLGFLCNRSDWCCCC